MPGPALISSTSQYSTARGPTPSGSPAPPAPPTASSKPNYSAFSGFGISQPIPLTTTSQPSLFQQQQQQKAAAKIPQQPTSDPFAALATPPRQPTPLQNQSSVSASMFDFTKSAPPATAIPPAPANDDDEWSFSSALPESNGLPSSNSITITDSTINISVHATRKSPSDPIITLTVKFSSKVAQLITELTFQVAVTKVRHPNLPLSPIDLSLQFPRASP
jgi:ADP-ribosylation factor-binding protein GGA